MDSIYFASFPLRLAKIAAIPTAPPRVANDPPQGPPPKCAPSIASSLLLLVGVRVGAGPSPSLVEPKENVGVGPKERVGVGAGGEGVNVEGTIAAASFRGAKPLLGSTFKLVSPDLSGIGVEIGTFLPASDGTICGPESDSAEPDNALTNDNAAANSSGLIFF